MIVPEWEHCWRVLERCNWTALQQRTVYVAWMRYRMHRALTRRGFA